MRHLLIAGLLLLPTSYIYAGNPSGGLGYNDPSNARSSPLAHKTWIHGAADCKSNTDPAIEVYQHDHSSYILRQNKCLHFEAPFIYLLIGDKTALVLDTGATKSAAEFPLYDTVRALIRERSEHDEGAVPNILVIHSHSHGDHHRGDSQFTDKPHVTLVAPKHAAMTEFFAFSEWPDGEASIELGGRELTILPSPGHQEDAISVYDPQTQWLLTGDTFYPGYIYVKHWEEYKQSISRLAAFATTHEISAVLGAHIEMSDQAGEYYPIGTVYQPDEAPLALTADNLASLNVALKQADKPQTITRDEFIVAPMGAAQKFLSNFVRWLTQ